MSTEDLLQKQKLICYTFNYQFQYSMNNKDKGGFNSLNKR